MSDFPVTDTRGSIAVVPYETSLFSGSSGGASVYIVGGTTDDPNLLKPLFMKKLDPSLPVQEIIVSRDMEGIRIYAICERLNEEEADKFYNSSLEFQLEHQYHHLDISLIELRGRKLTDLNIF